MNYRKMDDIKPLPRITYYPSSVPVTSPNQIFRANDYESYILRQPPKRNVTYVSNTYDPNSGVSKSYKTIDETQKFNQSGIIKERHHYILYQNRNWTEKKKIPIVEVKKVQKPQPIKTLRKVTPNYNKRKDIQKKKKIVKEYNYKENNIKEEEGINYENDAIIEETIVKKIIKTEEYYDEEDTGYRPKTAYKKNRVYKKIPINVF